MPEAVAMEHDVAIVGGGPAGLSAAMALKERGIRSVVVLEREHEPGGVPRHCGHPPFGFREFRRILTGPTYARRLVDRANAAGIDIRTYCTVVEARPSGELLLATPEGGARLSARRVILATGIRETSRAARLIGGTRPLGVLTTGALQSMVHFAGAIPFRRPIVIGTELVSFSALLTCRQAGIAPVAMIEEGPRPVAWWSSVGLPLVLGVSLHFNARVVAIHGRERVESVTIQDQHGERSITCDGVLFTGRFTPEATLARMGHIEIDADTGGPLVDQYGRCSDFAYYAAGNLLRPVETAGWCWHEGREVGFAVAADLAGKLPAAGRRARIRTSRPVRYAVPQKIAGSATKPALSRLQVRVDRPVHGTLDVFTRNAAVWSRRISALPERRILAPLPPTAGDGGEELVIGVRSEQTGATRAPGPVEGSPRRIGEEGRQS